MASADENKRGGSFCLLIPHLDALSPGWLEFFSESIAPPVIHNKAQPTDYNRNVLVRKFLERSEEWAIFVDSDVIPPRHVGQLTSHGKKIVSALVLQLVDGLPRPTLYRRYADLETELPAVGKGNYCWVGLDLLEREEELYRVDVVGTGCLAIHREVFEKIGFPWFRFREDEDGILYGEDVWFSERAREAGYSLYVDPAVQCVHERVISLNEYALWAQRLFQAKSAEDLAKWMT